MKNIRTYSINNLPPSQTDWKQVHALSEKDIMEAAMSDPDAQPLTQKQLNKFKKLHQFHDVNVKKLRQQLNFSQAVFASLFGISKRTVEEWEQGRRQPSGASRTLLNLIEKNPKKVIDLLVDRELA